MVNMVEMTYVTYTCFDGIKVLFLDGKQPTSSLKNTELKVQIVHETMQQMLQSL